MDIKELLDHIEFEIEGWETDKEDMGSNKIEHAFCAGNIKAYKRMREYIKEHMREEIKCQ